MTIAVGTDMGRARRDPRRPIPFVRVGFVAFPLSVLVVSGCTTLGPVAAVSGQSMAVNRRTNAEVQIAAVPGYFLSDATTEERGRPQKQAAVLFEPSRLLPFEGLSAGGRWVGGGDGEGHFEPMLRYRTAIDEERSVGVGAVAWGTKHDGSARGASYEATHAGIEAGTDIRLTPESHWVEVHGTMAMALTALDASGTYCSGEDRKGRDCGADPDDERPNATASVSALYPAGMLGIALDMAGRFDGPFHGVRVFVMAGGGWMPRVRAGESTDMVAYQALGLGLALTAGAPADGAADGTADGTADGKE